MDMCTNHGKFQREVLISLLWHVYKRFTQFSSTWVCGLFDDNERKKGSESNLYLARVNEADIQRSLD